VSGVLLDLETLLLIAALVVAGTLATDVWRVAGVFLARGLKPESRVVLWIKDVSTALLAGLVARLVFFPPEAMADVPLFVRLIAFASTVLIFLLAGQRPLFSIAAGLVFLVAAQWALRV
jgi:branched-subunit amino acid transport protein